MKKKEKLKKAICLSLGHSNNLTSNIYNQDLSLKKPINLSSIGDVNIGDNPSPSNYTYCAGNSCVTCVTEWDESIKKYKQTCTHYTITLVQVHEGG